MWNIITIWNSSFLCEYVVQCNLFLWSNLYFQHHSSSLQCHMIFRNHNNMLIYWSRHISDYYQCWKQLCCPIFWWIKFFRIHRWIESSKEQHLFEIEIFCNIINVFTGTFDQLNASLINKSINSSLLSLTANYTKISGCTTVFNIDNNNTCFLSTKSVYDNDFWRSCDTEDWRNDAENTDLITEINDILKYIHRKQLYSIVIIFQIFTVFLSKSMQPWWAEEIKTKCACVRVRCCICR